MERKSIAIPCETLKRTIKYNILNITAFAKKIYQKENYLKIFEDVDDIRNTTNRILSAGKKQRK